MGTYLRFPKKILLGLQEGSCNLKCPKCYTHGPNPISQNVRHKGLMDFENFKKILAEVKEFKPRIAPQTWDEPLLNKDIFKYLEEIKKNDLAITMDTNGLLLDAQKMQSFVDLKVDSVFISVDAFLPETYKKVRGLNKLEELKAKIHEFLKIRGDSFFPRIGVSFVIEKDNSAEVEDFVNYWKNHVDVVRVNEQFMKDRQLSAKSELKFAQRTACWSLDDSLMIHFNGEAALCCVDTHYENQIGNVFESGVVDVWNGKFFSEVRQSHQEGDFAKIKICQKCQLWSHDKPVTRTQDNILISQTTTHTYYNRIEKLENILQNRFV